MGRERVSHTTMDITQGRAHVFFNMDSYVGGGCAGTFGGRGHTASAHCASHRYLCSSSNRNTSQSSTCLPSNHHGSATAWCAPPESPGVVSHVTSCAARVSPVSRGG